MSDDWEELEAYVRSELPGVIRLLQGSRVQELALRSDGAELIVERAKTEIEAAVSLEAAVSQSEEREPRGPHVATIASPMVGVFYHSEQPGRAALVEPGTHIDRGSLIGVIEALQVLTEVESDTAGVVQKVVAEDGQPVEFGQPLVEVLVEG